MTYHSSAQYSVDSGFIHNFVATMSLICIRDYEKRAAEILPKGDLDYYRSGDSLMTTIHLNRDCYQRLIKEK